MDDMLSASKDMKGMLKQRDYNGTTMVKSEDMVKQQTTFMPGATLKASVSPMDLGKELWESLGHLDDLIVGPPLTAEGPSTAASAHDRFISNPTCSVLYWNSKHTTEFYRLFKGHEKERQIERQREEQERDLGLAEEDSHRLPGQKKTKKLLIVNDDPEKHYVFRQYMVEAQTYASCIVTLGGYQHDLPVVVRACCEEICRSGINSPTLFRLQHNRERVQQLKDAFNKGPLYGADVCLQGEALADICALLRLYLESLRYSPLNSAIFDAFQSWCVLTTFDSQRITTADPKSSNPSVQVVYDLQATDKEEDLWVEIASTLFKLLPAANGSLLSYMMCFSCRVIHHSPQNHLKVEDVCRMFAGILLAPNRLSSDPDANSMMAWILRRWPRIYQKLFNASFEIS